MLGIDGKNLCLDEGDDLRKLGKGQPRVERCSNTAGPDGAEQELKVAMRIEREDADALSVADSKPTKDARRAAAPIRPTGRSYRKLGMKRPAAHP